MLASRLRQAARLAPTPFASQFVPKTMRFASTQRPAPAAVAGSLIDLFPGSSPAQKSSAVLVSASVAAWLVSKELYLIDAEFFEMLCIFGAYYILWSGGKEGAIAYFEERKNTIKRVLTQARQDHKAVVQERIDHVAKLSNVVPETQSLYEISKVFYLTQEIAKMEAEAYELKQKVGFTNDVKQTLDSWVRYEANVRDQEQKRLVKHVVDQVKSKLADPKLQKAILAQTIADVATLTAAK